MRTWTRTALAALLTASVVAPAWAAPETPTVDEKDKLTLVLIQLQEVKSKLNSIQENQDLQIHSMQGDISQLKADLNRLSEEFHRLNTVQPNIAASINPAAPAVALVNGTVALENLYSSPATIRVNGRDFRVMPFERINVTVPVGRFTYAVYTDNYGLVQGETNRFLAPGREFPITVNP